MPSSSSYHHIHFRAPFSSTDGWPFWQLFLEGVLSTQNDFEGQQNPYLASFCHSQALHPMISFACQIFSVQPHSACVLLQSSQCCALHVQTISSYWCRAPHLSPGCQALWEGSLSELRPLPWHCRSNGSWHGHYAGDGSVYPPSWPKSLLHAASHSSHMMSTPYLWSEGADGGWWEGEAIGGTCPMHICSVWSQPARSHLLQRACPQGSRTLGQLLFVSNLNLWNFSFIDSPSSPKASGAPELRVRAQGSLNATAFLMHPALAATTEDCIRATNSWLTDTTGVLSQFLQHVQINARLHNLCLPHVHT